MAVVARRWRLCCRCHIDTVVASLSTPQVPEAVADPFLLNCFGTAAITAPTAAPVAPEAARDAATPATHTSTATPSTATLTVIMTPEGGGGGGGGGGRRRQQQALLHYFAPGRRHTRHELVRMWAAERVLEAERSALAETFQIRAPVLQANDHLVCPWGSTPLPHCGGCAAAAAAVAALLPC